MTDRKMLELAAKAAGYRVLDENVEGIDVCFERPGYLPVEIIGWNPLTDDGEAFRLMVTLCLSLIQRPDGTSVTVVFPPNTQCAPLEEPRTYDPLAATRRAIVRAAAEIGKGMK